MSVYIINEEKRSTLVSRSKTNPRYKRSKNVSIITAPHSFDRIDMNKLFQNDILEVVLGIHGETDDYDVIISFSGFLKEIKTLIKNNPQAIQNKRVNMNMVLRALKRAFDTNDIYEHCSCPDHKYRFRYWSTTKRYNAGQPELRFPKITNPNDSLGSGCKHTIAVLKNNSWLVKVASVINNYIKYLEKRLPKLYEKFIYTALFADLRDDEDEVDNTPEDMTTNEPTDNTQPTPDNNGGQGLELPEDEENPEEGNDDGNPN